jgi:uncharacterized protein YndB with AHSA1/START domain
MSTRVKSGARAVADVAAGRILASVEIAAPVERVFRALTTAADITSWWGSPELYRTTGWEADVRPGGSWRAHGVGADGHAFSVEGQFLEVEPPRKLVQTWKAGWDGDHETTLAYRLEPIDGGTRITLRHEGFADRVHSCRGHAEGWERVFGWLASYLTPAEELRTFMCRLLPPRPTFALDMSDEEAGIMKEHASYWRALLEEGSALLYGPVADPSGPWGLGMIRVPDQAKLDVLCEGDPAIRSKRGFRYETLPMIKAVTRS